MQKQCSLTLTVDQNWENHFIYKPITTLDRALVREIVGTRSRFGHVPHKSVIDKRLNGGRLQP